MSSVFVHTIKLRESIRRLTETLRKLQINLSWELGVGRLTMGIQWALYETRRKVLIDTVRYQALDCTSYERFVINSLLT